MLDSHFTVVLKYFTLAVVELVQEIDGAAFEKPA
jgi:hypothetical protein